MRQGWPLLHDITTCYTDLMALMKKMPDRKSINDGLWLMHRHLGVASAVAEHTNFATGESNTLFTEEHPPPPLTLLSAASLRKRKASVKDANWKKWKVDTGIADEPAANFPLLNLDEHFGCNGCSWLVWRRSANRTPGSGWKRCPGRQSGGDQLYRSGREPVHLRPGLWFLG